MIMTREQFIATSGVQVQTLEFWIEQEWLIPDQTPSGPTFTEVEVARARLIQDLISNLGVNEEGVDVILHLTDQIHGLRRALLEVRDSM
jgi:chaperone modulatory protein CbpM